MQGSGFNQTGPQIGVRYANVGALVNEAERKRLGLLPQAYVTAPPMKSKLPVIR